MAIIRKNPILQETAHVVIPIILLYALYVQFHGDFGPGGGFQAGVIFSAALLLYSLIYGFEQLLKIISCRSAEILACSGLLLYSGVGFTTLVLGGNFLDYAVLAEQPLAGQHLGIFLVELGIGITLVGVLVNIFALFMNPNHNNHA